MSSPEGKQCSKNFKKKISDLTKKNCFANVLVEVSCKKDISCEVKQAMMTNDGNGVHVC